MKTVYKYEKEYVIRTYECDKNSDLRLLTLMNIFQDSADGHAADMELGLEFCLAHGLAWVGSNYHIMINRLPKMHEKIKVITWPAVEKKLGAVRDFTVLSEKGETLIRAASQWVLINFEKKRPVSLRDNLPEYQVIPERALESDFNKLPEVAQVDRETVFNIRFDDIDLNNHVNNAVYPLWASEAVDLEFRLKHSPAEIEIAFKKEGHYGERIKVLTQMTDDKTSLHSVIALTDDRELARVKIAWK